MRKVKVMLGPAQRTQPSCGFVPSCVILEKFRENRNSPIEKLLEQMTTEANHEGLYVSTDLVSFLITLTLLPPMMPNLGKQILNS